MPAAAKPWGPERPDGRPQWSDAVWRCPRRQGSGPPAPFVLSLPHPVITALHIKRGSYEKKHANLIFTGGLFYNNDRYPMIEYANGGDIRGMVRANEAFLKLNGDRKQLEGALAMQARRHDRGPAPTALTRYLAAVGQLAAKLATQALDPTQESLKALRELADCVIVHPPTHIDETR
jgi:hypothetical protein